MIFSILQTIGFWIITLMMYHDVYDSPPWSPVLQIYNQDEAYESDETNSSWDTLSTLTNTMNTDSEE